jgi:F-type H+-transporting ATPase subunit b
LITSALAAGGGEVPEGIGIFLPAAYDIIWSLVPFIGIMIFFFGYGVPRFRKILDDRAAAIEGGIAKADVMQKQAEEALEHYSAQLAEARAEAAKIREQARVDAQRIGSEITSQAHADADRTKANAQVAIEADRQAALVSLRSEVGVLALDLASGVIEESLADDQKATALVDRFLADLESSETSGKK